MPTSSEVNDVALQLMLILKDEGVLKARLQEYMKMKLDAEAAITMFEQKENESAKTQADLDSYVASKKAELAVAQKEADRAAAEAKARIDLGNKNMAEVLRVQDQNKDKEAELAQREAVVNGAAQSMEETKRKTDAALADATRLQNSWANKHQRLSALLAEIGP